MSCFFVLTPNFTLMTIQFFLFLLCFCPTFPLLRWPILLLSSVDSYFAVVYLKCCIFHVCFFLGPLLTSYCPWMTPDHSVTCHHLLTVKMHSGQLCSSELLPPLSASQASLLVLNTSHQFSIKIGLSEWWDRVQLECCHLLFFFSPQHPIDP